MTFDVRQLHVQLQQHTEDEQMTLSTPDSSRTDSPKNIATDEDVDAALDDLQMTLSGEEADSPTSLLKKCPELRGYLLVYQ